MKSTIEYYYLFLQKDGHRYYFKFQAGREKYLYFELIRYGKEKEFNLGLIEILDIIRQIATWKRVHGGLKDFRFNINRGDQDGMQKV